MDSMQTDGATPPHGGGTHVPKDQATDGDQALSIPAQYSITRTKMFSQNNAQGPLWAVNFTRRKRAIKRYFFDSTYGGKAQALLMAQAYRDAAMRLFPPSTRMALNTQLRKTNTSGVTGVYGIRKNGKLTAWSAILISHGKRFSRTFSIQVHGIEGAWQQAIAARQEFQVHCQDRFVIQCPEATADAMRRFPELLEHAGRLPETDAARDAMYRQLLDAWFDAMRPPLVHVRLSIHPIPCLGSDGLFLVAGQPGQLQHKKWSLRRRSYADCLEPAWAHVEQVLTRQMGIACWQEFQSRYRHAFFASAQTSHLLIRMRHNPPDGHCLRHTPPAPLQPLLQGFAIPVLPPAESADGIC